MLGKWDYSDGIAWRLSNCFGADSWGDFARGIGTVRQVKHRPLGSLRDPAVCSEVSSLSLRLSLDQPGGPTPSAENQCKPIPVPAACFLTEPPRSDPDGVLVSYSCHVARNGPLIRVKSLVNGPCSSWRWRDSNRAYAEMCTPRSGVLYTL